ncbi:MAG TPA: hypothetical protein PKH77_28735 [Anaerolineae bacterium]|nr:hypothetical protein [Anaerolineae bacterium]
MTQHYETLSFGSLKVFFAVPEREAAELIGAAAETSARLIREHWGLEIPPEVRLYVMTSWLAPMFHAASWPLKILMGMKLPLWGWGARRLWRVAGGWAQPLGRRRMVGVKPPRLIQTSDSGFGARIFVPEPDMARKAEQITCHELTHAATAHLELPAWLNEGIAMLTVDRFVGSPTVKAETAAVLAHAPATPRSRRLPQDPDALVYVYVRGYWLTRYFEETRPGMLKDLLTQRHPPAELENRIAAAYGIEQATFWRDLDERVAAHFKPSA